MKKVITIIGLLIVVAGLAYHFAALDIFNLLVPKDAGSKLVRADVAYGPLPRQRLDIYAPVEAARPLPVVLFVHGGSWQEGRKELYAFAGRALAAQEFVTLVMNYRWFPEGPYPAFVDDVDLALRWAAQHAHEYGGDAHLLFAMGHSAGAYNVAQAVLNGRYATGRPAISGAVTLAGPFDFVPLDSPVTVKVFGAVPDLRETQPIHHARADAPPFLILHGGADKTVFPRNAHALHNALGAAGASSTLKVYEKVSHVGILLALAKPFRKTPVLEDAANFIRDKSQ